MKLSLLSTLAIAGTVGAFQGLAKNNKVSSSPVDVRLGAPLTKADMVAIRSPFGNAFTSHKTPEAARIDYVVDRDYTVALTLMSVGIWLTMFHPSK